MFYVVTHAINCHSVFLRFNNLLWVSVKFCILVAISVSKVYL